ncbi:MAG: type III pantothenate kinase, partial [Chroococcidiopsidaceae cyanobacterium CP_BM_RX_35]|nr:type III pantothenate kinase [Chroococcidiopsidaceae cyanobacterium CP_BM_RX_35]
MNRRSADDADDTKRSWLGLMIGNSRLHWAWFIEETLCCAWDTAYLPDSAVEQLAQCQAANFVPPNLFHNQESMLPLHLASVVPSQTRLWQAYPDVLVITLEQLPLQGTYSTLGIDRALALWGAGETWGWPVLTIDAGTGLTLTGADANRCLVGGAILPGLGLQFQSLAQSTAQLP